MLLTLGVIWGGPFYFYAVALQELPTFTIVFLRVLIGTAVLWSVALAMGFALPRSAEAWRNFFLLGLLNNVIPFSLIVWGQHQVASGLAAILNATTPFFTVLAANALTHDEKLSWNRLFGAVVGLAGVAAMMGADVLAGLGASLPYQLAIVGAAINYAFASIFGRRFAQTPPIITAAGQTTASATVLLPIVLIVDAPWRLPVPSTQVILAIIGLAVICTSFAYVLFFTILKRAGATNIVLVTFLVPVSAVILGAVLLDERLGPQHAFGGVAIAFGLALIDGRLFTRLRQ
ncbi:MAG TPA: DMT family transporter [Vicinamibacterales bacterium]|nr:DMT family transporter [Vicinamibacterales bacterium]